MIVRFHGTRGSIPAPGRDRVRYGGNTPCLEVICGERRIIIDAGTGIRHLGSTLDHGESVDFDLIITHYHWDHIQGFPFFWPIYDRRTNLRIHGLTTPDVTPRAAIGRHMERPVFPIAIGDLPSKIYFDGVRPGRTLKIDDVTIHTGPNIHPGGCLGLRFEYKGRVFTHLTDNECPNPAQTLEIHQPSFDLSHEADVVSFDVTFTEDEYQGRVDGVPRRGWGHASDKHGVAFARACKAKKFLFFHHAPEHDDAFLDQMAGRARAAYSRIFMSVDGLEVHMDDDEPSKPPRFVYPAGGRPRYPAP